MGDSLRTVYTRANGEAFIAPRMSFQRPTGRNAFTGIMTRNTCTKAAHLACLKEMLPAGNLTPVGEQEASMARVVPHIFREEILADRFEWHVANFDKDAKKPQILRRTKAFDAFRAFRDANPKLTVPEAFHA